MQLAAQQEPTTVSIVTAGLPAEMVKWLQNRFPGAVLRSAPALEELLQQLQSTPADLLLLDSENAAEVVAALGPLRKNPKYAQMPVFCCLPSSTTRPTQQKLVRFLGVKQLF